MKKIAVLSAFVLALASTSAFAASSDYTNTSGGAATLGSTSTLTIQLSTNVGIDYNAASLGAGYAVATAHNKGTKSFGSSSGDAKIWSHTTLYQAAPTAPTGTASADFSGWTGL